MHALSVYIGDVKIMSMQSKHQLLIRPADLPTALARVSFTWLVSQPVAAAQLVLVTAAEGQSLVGASNFASKLPLAATGKLCQSHAQHKGNCFQMDRAVFHALGAACFRLPDMCGLWLSQ